MTKYIVVGGIPVRNKTRGQIGFSSICKIGEFDDSEMAETCAEQNQEICGGLTSVIKIEVEIAA